MGTLPDAGSAIFVALSGDSTLAALIGGTANARVYAQQAPSGAELPYVVYYQASGLIPNTSPRDATNWVYRVDGWGSASLQAWEVQQAIYGALHEQSLTISGWTNYWLACEAVVELPPENVAGRQYWRVTGNYRVKFSA